MPRSKATQQSVLRGGQEGQLCPARHNDGHTEHLKHMSTINNLCKQHNLRASKKEAGTGGGPQEHSSAAAVEQVLRAPPRCPQSQGCQLTARLRYPPAETICHVSARINSGEPTVPPEAEGCQTPKETPRNLAGRRQTQATRRAERFSSLTRLGPGQPSAASVIRKIWGFKLLLQAAAPPSPEVSRSSPHSTHRAPGSHHEGCCLQTSPDSIRVAASAAPLPASLSPPSLQLPSSPLTHPQLLPVFSSLLPFTCSPCSHSTRPHGPHGCLPEEVTSQLRSQNLDLKPSM